MRAANHNRDGKPFALSGARYRPWSCWLVWCAGVAIALVGACAPIRTEGFAEFSQGSRDLARSGDEAVEGLARRSEARALAGGVLGASSGLIVREGAEPWAIQWKADAPLVVRLDAFGAGVSELGEGLRAYALALERMAGAEQTSERAFGEGFARANASIARGRRALGLGEVGERDALLVSSVASAAFRAYARSRQRDELLRALREVQRAMPELANAGQDAARILAAWQWQEYEVAAQPLRVAIDVDHRADAWAELLHLSREHASSLTTLRRLHDAYAGLPDAHQALIDGLGAGDGTDGNALRDWREAIARVGRGLATDQEGGAP